MNVIYLSNMSTLGSTSRILQYWLRLGRNNGLHGNVVVRKGSHFIEWGRSQGINTLVDPMPWPSRRAPWSCLWHAARVGRWAKRANTEIIHCNEHDSFPFAVVLKRILNRPTVCHVRYRLERGFAEWAFRGNRAPDALLWTSYQQKADSADAIEGLVPEDRQHVVRLGVDVNECERFRNDRATLRQKWGIATTDILIGMPSPLRPRKRVEDFIELIRRLATADPRITGIIAGQEVRGDELYRQRIEREIAASGLGPRLRWVGYLNPVEPFHHACDISISTSEYETFGNSICEAMACGKPVAAYRAGSVEEVLGNTGLIVETRDLQGLQSAVKRLVADPSLRAKLGSMARHRVATEFDPSISFRQIEAIYSGLLAAA